MSLFQLIIVWWGFFAVAALLLMHGSSTIIWGILGLIALVLLVHSFGRHHKTSRHKIMLAIGLPMMLFGIGGFISGGSVDNPQLDFSTNSGINLPNDSVKILSAQLTHKFFVDKISGSIQNSSQMNINQLGLKVTLDARTSNAEEWYVPLKNLNIAPGQSSSFQTQIGDFHFRPNAKWKWNFQVVSVIGG